MKPGFVSAVAVLICCAIIAVAGAFGYSRYKASQVKDAQFRAQIQNPANQQAPLPARLPQQMPAGATTTGQ